MPCWSWLLRHIHKKYDFEMVSFLVYQFTGLSNEIEGVKEGGTSLVRCGRVSEKTSVLRGTRKSRRSKGKGTRSQVKKLDIV